MRLSRHSRVPANDPPSICAKGQSCVAPLNVRKRVPTNHAGQPCENGEQDVDEKVGTAASLEEDGEGGQEEADDIE